MGGAPTAQAPPRRPLTRLLLRPLPAVFVVAVVATAIARAAGGHPTAREFALTPDRLAHGKVWLFATSAIIVNGPPVLQIVGLVPTLVASVRRLGAAFTGALMIVAHVGATLLAYGVLIVFTGDADGAHNRKLDYGISAVWMGALGALWALALPHVRQREPLALFMAALGTAAFVFGVSTFSVLAATEHGLAFALGALMQVLRNRAQPAVVRL